MKLSVSFLFYVFKEIIEVGNKMLQGRCMQYKIVLLGFFYKAQENAVFLFQAFFSTF